MQCTSPWIYVVEDIKKNKIIFGLASFFFFFIYLLFLYLEGH